MQKNKAILIVDDDPLMCEAVTKVLQEVGYPVTMAFDGQKALDLLNKQSFDLILADIEMPMLNGYQLLQHVRQHPDWCKVPLVFLSGRNLDSDIRFGKQLGADDYLVKPLNVPDLLACVEGKLIRFEHLTKNVSTALPIPQSQQSSCYQVGSLRINPRQHRAWQGDDSLSLSAREFALLNELASCAGDVVSPQSLVKVTHNLNVDENEAGVLIRPLIRTLRRRLGYSTGEASCIENVRGVGYRLLPPQ